MLEGLFLDRDGVILEMVTDPDHGLVDSARRPQEVRLVSGVANLIAWANDLRIPVACLTNQPGLAKGTCRPRHVDEVHAEMTRQLQQSTGARIDHIGVCSAQPERLGSPLDKDLLLPQTGSRASDRGTRSARAASRTSAVRRGWSD